MFVQYGIDGIAMEFITVELNISKQTIYSESL